MLSVAVADIHGDKVQYKKLLQLVKERGISHVFMAGDLLPKTGGSWSPDNKIRTVAMQREFIESFFLDYLRSLGGVAAVYAIFGNDDFKANYELVEQAAIPNVYFLNNQVIKLQGTQDDMYVAGYPNVALTPFLHKDWEKWDTEQGDTNQKVLRTDGFLIDSTSHHPVDFVTDTRLATIREDLEQLAIQSNPSKTVYVFHEAPYNTPLDQVAGDNKYIRDGQVHVGSHAVREFITKHHPLITIHGHIHETLEQSGDFRWISSDSISVTPANDFASNELSYVLLDLADPSSASRLSL